MLATFRASAQDVIEESRVPVGRGGRMRVDTRFLSASLQASTERMPQIDADARPTKGQTYSIDSGAVALVIAGADLGETIYAGFVAAYSRYREYKDGFVRGAAENWQKIVDKNARKAMQRIK